MKESGLHYGDYVAANPDAMQPKKEEEKRIRICKTCGKAFEVKKQKDRQTYCRHTRCEECRGQDKTEYKLICQSCGVEITAKTKYKKLCDDCRKDLQRVLLYKARAGKKI